MLSGECPDNTGFIQMESASFGRIQSLFFSDLEGKRLASKAEVAGSNPVGCANNRLKNKDIFILPVR